MKYSLIKPKTNKEEKVCQAILDEKFAIERSCKEHIERFGLISYLAHYTYRDNEIPIECLNCLKPLCDEKELKDLEAFEIYNMKNDYDVDPIFKIKDLDKWFNALRLCGLLPKKRGTTYRLISKSDRELGIIIDKIGECEDNFKNLEKANEYCRSRYAPVMIGNREIVDMLIGSGWESILRNRFYDSTIGRECHRDIKDDLDDVFKFLHTKGY